MHGLRVFSLQLSGFLSHFASIKPAAAASWLLSQSQLGEQDTIFLDMLCEAGIFSPTPVHSKILEPRTFEEPIEPEIEDFEEYKGGETSGVETWASSSSSLAGALGQDEDGPTLWYDTENPEEVSGPTFEGLGMMQLQHLISSTTTGISDVVLSDGDEGRSTSGWVSQSMENLGTASVEPAQPTRTEISAAWGTKSPIVPLWSELPQSPYRPQGIFQPRHPFFFATPGMFGIAVNDACESRCPAQWETEHVDIFGDKAKISCRVLWPGYSQCLRRAVNVRDDTQKRNPLSKQRVARNFGRALKSIVEELVQYKCSQPNLWEVSPDLALEDIVMTELRHVSGGSWQPVLYIRKWSSRWCS